jgi:hypothetical protein
MVVGQGMLRDAEDPSAKALAITQAEQPAVQTDENLLYDVIGIRFERHPPRHIRSQSSFQLVPSALSMASDHAQVPLLPCFFFRAYPTKTSIRTRGRNS